MELLVSIAIFMFLGIMLVSVFKSGLDMWHAGEAGKIVFRNARNVLTIIKDDITHMTVHDYPRDGGAEVDVKFIADLIDVQADDYHPQRVRFVRALTGEMSHTLLKDAGTYTVNDPCNLMAQYDGFDDKVELTNFSDAAKPKLGAPGGLMEVGYLCYGEKLYRAVRAPIGYTGTVGAGLEALSLFNGPVFFGLGLKGDSSSFSDAILTDHARVLAANVLHFEMRFWAPDTETWDITPAGRKAKEASLEWDSTRVKTNAPEDFPFDFDDAAARPGDPSDDIFPPKVRVDLVLDADRRTRVLTRLVSMAGTGSATVAVTTGFVKAGLPDRLFIKIGNEWIGYTGADETTFTGITRGMRQTEEEDHDPGTEVYQGRLFSQVMDVPGVMNE